MSGSDPVGLGVIGGRSMVATRAVLPAVGPASGTHLAAISARGGRVPRPWRRAAVPDYDDVLRHPAVEAVYVPLPNSMHREWVERAAAAGKHVLCEKPLAATAPEAAAMEAACVAAGVLLAEAWMTPFDPRWSEAARLAVGGTIGPVHTVEASFTFTIPPEASDNYRWDPTQGGGALLDVGIYCLGPAVELWGARPTAVRAEIDRSPSGVDATTVVELDWGGGRTAHARCSFTEPETQRLTYVGPGGRLVLDGDAHTGGRTARAIHLTRDDGGTPVDDVIEVVPDDPYRRMLGRFADAVRGRVPWPRPAARSVELAALLDRIRHSGGSEVPAP